MALLLGPQKRNPIKESPCDLIAMYFTTLQESLLKSFPENFPWKGSGEKGAGSPSGLFTIYCFWKQKRAFFYKQLHCVKKPGDSRRRKPRQPGCNISQLGPSRAALRAQCTFTCSMDTADTAHCNSSGQQTQCEQGHTPLNA